MRIVRIKIQNFRGIKQADLLLESQCVFVGDNNTGKSTVLEAIDLVMGPERLSRPSVIDEHDFFAGSYLSSRDEAISIYIEVWIIGLNDEQKRHFRNNLEWYDPVISDLIVPQTAESTDADGVQALLRVGFRGYYDQDDDDFKADTFFLHPHSDEEDKYEPFRKTDKRICGFLFLRTLRTGSRALSLERGSLLDIILRLHELRPKMWEDVLIQLRGVAVASDPELGISAILDNIQKAVRSFVPSEWADSPHLRVSSLTREELRRVITVFMATGVKDESGVPYAAPFQHQGTGTINMLVLALLVMISELKQNVIFAMEEPEIAIPPHTQKRIINSVTSQASQSIFTSHSPYVLEEFTPEHIVVVKREKGILTGTRATYPPAIKPRKYKEEFFKRRYCEALLARRIFIMEGRTELDVFHVAARRLHELNPAEYQTLEAMGIAVINAETDSQVKPLGEFFRRLGKVVYAAFDKQDDDVSQAIAEVVDYPFEAAEKGMERIVVNQTEESALRRFANTLVNDNEWPTHLASSKPTPSMLLLDLKSSLFEFFKAKKGQGYAADLIAQCLENEVPSFVKEVLSKTKKTVEGSGDEDEVEDRGLSF